MKARSIVCLLFFLLINSYDAKAVINENDSLLYNIQEKVYNAFLSSFKDESPKQLVKIEQSLKRKSGLNQITTYWYLYTRYYKSLHYLKMNDKKKSINELSLVINALESAKNKNSELYALLAYLQSFSTQYHGGVSAASISMKVKKNAQMALKLDSTNLRAWYVLASNDYYTPVAYGGGKKCEEYLLKGIFLKDQAIANPYMPSWGKSDTYSLLISYYINKENFTKAKHFLNIALSLYPNNYMINQYVNILEGK